MSKRYSRKINFAALQPTSVVSRRDSLLIALLFASILHAFILLGVKGNNEPQQADKAIDITLVSIPSLRIQRHVRALAMLNQEGGGQKHTKPAAPLPKPKPVPEVPQNKVVPKVPEPEPLPLPLPLPKPQATQKVITQKTVLAKPSVVTAEKIAKEVKIEKVEKKVVKEVEQEAPKPLLSSADLEMQIAQLGKEIAKRQPSEEDTRIKYLNQISAQQYLGAQYISDWQEKVERIGNLNYPEIARKKGFTGKLILDVGIKADGSIYSMRISKSSGYPELDAAAKKIVQMSAPFSALPKALLNEVDVLVIKRVWSFSDEAGMSTN